MGRMASWCVVGLALILAGCGGGGGGNPGGGGGGNQLVSALGTPSGSAVSDLIDAAGGEITDGASFKLTIPPGALATATTIKVTPLSNDATPWGDTTTGFGITGLASFTLPVTLSIKYTGTGTQSPSADTLGVAMQDGSGKWWNFGDPTWDGTSLTVTLDPAVLSGLSKAGPAPGSAARAAGSPAGPNNAAAYIYDRIYIHGPSDIFVDDTENYVLAKCDPAKKDGDNAALLRFDTGVCQPLQLHKADASWQVNAVSPPGNGTVGFLALENVTDSLGSYVELSYHAPATVPSQNPVDMSAAYLLTQPFVPTLKGVTIHEHGKFKVRAFFDDPFVNVCVQAPQTYLDDQVTFHLTPVGDTGIYDVSGIADSDTIYGDPPNGVFDVVVVIPPEYLTTTAVTATLLQLAPTKQAVQVAIFGTQTTATCWYTDPKTGEVLIKENGSTSDPHQLPAFQFDPDPSQFTKVGDERAQIIPPDYDPLHPPLGWHYVITEE